MDNIQDIILKEIKESDIFNYNSMFSISFETGVDINEIQSIIQNLLDTRKIHKHWYCPYEERFANEPIGNDSYETYFVKPKILNIVELMK